MAQAVGYMCRHGSDERAQASDVRWQSGGRSSANALCVSTKQRDKARLTQIRRVAGIGQPVRSVTTSPNLSQECAFDVRRT